MKYLAPALASMTQMQVIIIEGARFFVNIISFSPSVLYRQGTILEMKE